MYETAELKYGCSESVRSLLFLDSFCEHIKSTKMHTAKRPDLTKLLLAKRDLDMPIWDIALLYFREDASSKEGCVARRRAVCEGVGL
jgi:hypothetical protein